MKSWEPDMRALARNTTEKGRRDEAKDEKYRDDKIMSAFCCVLLVPLLCVDVCYMIK